MANKKLLWHLFRTYLGIILVVLLSVGFYALNSLRDFYYTKATDDLEARARLVETQVLKNMIRGQSASRLDDLSKKLGDIASIRITLIHPSGMVLGDSNKDPSRMDNHADRPEVKEATIGKRGSSIRFSQTLQKIMMYVAVPILKDGRVLGVVRTSLPLTSIDHELEGVFIKIAMGGLVIVLLAAMVSLWVARRITRPLEKMRLASEGFAKGNLKGRVPVPKSLEIASLAKTLNQMAKQLDERIHTVTCQRNEREAVLSSMVEGVIAVDEVERLISMNQAAAKLVGVKIPSFQGGFLQEVVGNAELLRFVRKTLVSTEVFEEELVIHDSAINAEKVIQAHGTLLKDEKNEKIGAVIVLNDVTLLRRLENIRRDFVANVSHELKTPITSMKGFVETLLSGAVKNSRDRKRFLEIIAKQIDRLNEILEDLLSLSRLEMDSKQSDIRLQDSSLKHLLETAIQDCSVKLNEGNTQVDLVCGEDLHAPFNPPLLEQAVVNLIDNAIKYSDPGNKINVEALQDNSEVVIKVRDRGCGIEREHLSRLFERFYRVDPGRSRELGGIGLGLAIVKHIAQVHEGTVSVQSSPGKGSVFSIHIPGPPGPHHSLH